MFVIENGREHFYQWDTGQRLIINDKTVVEVHYCNRTDDCSLVCEVYTDGGKRYADVPNILLQNDWQIRVYAFCGNYTKVEKRFEVVKRSKPADYVYTETEVKNWNALEDRVNNTLTAMDYLAVSVSSAEAERNIAEQERKEAETNRKEAEDARVAAFNTAMNEWETEVNTTVNDANTDVAAAVANAEAAANAANNAINMLMDNAHAAAIVCENTAGLININDAAAAFAVGATTHFAAKQEGSGEVSPTNIRPIVGYDTATITRTGKNLLGFNDYNITASTGVYTDSYSNGVFKREVKQYHTTTFAISSTALANIINPNIKAGTYTFTLKQTAGTTFNKPYLEITLNDGTKVNLQNGVPTTITQDGTITGVRMSNTQFNTGAVMEFVLQLEAGAATEYEPYNSTALTAELPETVYGGTLDWDTGLLTITHRKIELDGTQSIHSNAATNIGQFYITVSTDNKYKATSTKPYLCSHYPNGHAYEGLINKHVELKGNLLWIYDTGFGKLSTNVSAYLKEQKAAGTPVVLYYGLATPYTIQLTPQQLEMLKGYNNVWSESGETTIAYIADTKLYIDGKFAALQNAVISLGGNV